MIDNWPGITSVAGSNTAGNVIDYGQYWYPCNPYQNGYYYQSYVAPSWVYFTLQVTDCTNDIHVFPCPHCDLCKCGKAKKK